MVLPLVDPTCCLRVFPEGRRWDFDYTRGSKICDKESERLGSQEGAARMHTLPEGRKEKKTFHPRD